MNENFITKYNLVHYFGSKHQAVKVLKPYFPPFTQRDHYYYDIFCGSLALCFALNPKTVIINDKWNDLINFWECVKNNASELTHELDCVWSSRYWFEKFQQRTDSIGRAVFFYLRMLWCKGFSDNTFSYWNEVHTLMKDFTPWKQWFDTRQSIVMWDLDFREVLSRIINYDSKTRILHVVYCDPPYYHQGYKYHIPFIEPDHVDLHQLLEQMYDHTNKHIFLSYDDCPFIRNLYSNWYIKEVSWNVGNGIKRTDKEYHELLISNKPFKKYSQTMQKTYSQASISDLWKMD